MAIDQRYLFSGTAGAPSIGLYSRLVHGSESVRDLAGLSTTRVKTRLEIINDELDALMRRSDGIPGYTFKPTKHAYRSAKNYIFETYTKMGNSFPTPTFVLDGEGGIIIKWTTPNGRSVRLNCLPDWADQNYLYFENGEYDVEDNITPDILRERLNWLIQHEREPAR